MGFQYLLHVPSDHKSDCRDYVVLHIYPSLHPRINPDFKEWIGKPQKEPEQVKMYYFSIRRPLLVSKLEQKFQNFLKSRWDIVAALSLVVAFILRIWNIENCPPFFNDEADYAIWAYEIQHGNVTMLLRYLYSVAYLRTTGTRIYTFTPPYMMWFTAIVFSIFGDSNLSARLISCLSGVFLCAALYFLAKSLYPDRSKSFVVVASSLSPFLIFYSRVALPGSLMMTFTVFAMYFFVNWMKTGRIHDVIFASLLFALGFSTKGEAFLYIPCLLVFFLVYNFKVERTGSGALLLEGKLDKSVMKPLLGAVLVFLMTYMPILLYNYFNNFEMFQYARYSAFYERLTYPSRFPPIIPLSLYHLGNLWHLLTPPVFIVCLFGLFMALARHSKSDSLVLTWLLTNYVFYMFCLWYWQPHIDVAQEYGNIVLYDRKIFYSYARYTINWVPAFLLAGSSFLATIESKLSTKVLKTRLISKGKKTLWKSNRLYVLFLTLLVVLLSYNLVEAQEIVVDPWLNPATPAFHMYMVGMKEVGEFVTEYSKDKPNLLVACDPVVRPMFLWYTRNTVLIKPLRDFNEPWKFKKFIAELSGEMEIIFVFREWDKNLLRNFRRAFPDAPLFKLFLGICGSYRQEIYLYRLFS